MTRLLVLLLIVGLAAPALRAEDAPDPAPKPEEGETPAAPGEGESQPGEAPPAKTDETLPAVKRAADLLTGLTEVKNRLLGEVEYTLYLDGVQAGSTVMKVTRGEHGGKPVYLVALSSVMRFGPMTAKSTEQVKIAPDFSLIHRKVLDTQIQDGEEKRQEIEVTVADKVTITATGKDPVVLDRPERFLSGFESLFLLCRVLNATESFTYLFNTVDRLRSAVLEWNCIVDGKKVKRLFADGAERPVYLIRFPDPAQKTKRAFWTDGVGGMPGFEIIMPTVSMVYLLGAPKELPKKLEKTADPAPPAAEGPGPKEVTLDCLKGIYSADRRLLEGVFDFHEFYKRALGKDPEDAALAKFREGVLRAVTQKKNEEGLKSLDAIGGQLVVEVKENEALVRFDGKVKAKLHRKDGKWLIYWIAP